MKTKLTALVCKIDNKIQNNKALWNLGVVRWFQSNVLANAYFFLTK